MNMMPGSRSGHFASILALSMLLSGFGDASVHAQEAPLGVLVEQIAGGSIYLRAGTDDGISVNDTLLVLDESGDRIIGALLVVSATASRSVVSFLADPFSLTRGTMLSIRRDSGAAIPEPKLPVGPLRVSVRLEEGWAPRHALLRVSETTAALSLSKGWATVELPVLVDHEPIVFE